MAYYILRWRETEAQIIGPFPSAAAASDYGAVDQAISNDDPRWKVVRGPGYRLIPLLPARPVMPGAYNAAERCNDLINLYGEWLQENDPG